MRAITTDINTLWLILGLTMVGAALFSWWALRVSFRSLRQLKSAQNELRAEHQRRVRLQARLGGTAKDYQDKIYNRTYDYDLTSNEIQKRANKLSQANRKLAQLTFIDALTGVWNRSHFDNILRTEIARAARRKSPLGLLLIDIDQFKSFNEAYGNLQGDLALRKVAELIHQRFRRGGEMTARFNSDCFAVIIPNINETQTETVMHDVLSEIWAMPIPILNNQSAIRITASVGIAVSNSDQSGDSADMIAAARDGLLQAQRDGGNQISRCKKWPNRRAIELVS